MSELEILSVPLDAEMKREADEAFSKLGMTTADAARFFIRCALSEKENPLDALDPKHRIYNDETIAAFEEAFRIAHDPNAKRYASVEELMASLLEEDEDEE
ncbi:MAG TPA: type II toxin-antitoxin system RelB/DinJ family antitoxin [Candidatus Caccocola faecipullorum]|nr:type II toxin-antitoxin system RelB/DinJ family antitoxin [Candidatus Caccocola faecipullorum]